MKRVWSAIVFVASPLLALFAFMANQSADDTKKNIDSYVHSPLLRSVVAWLYGAVSSTWFLALSFFTLGCVATVLFRRWYDKRGALPPLEKLSTEVSLAAYSLDNMSSFLANPATIANLNVVLNKLRGRGYATPPVQNGAWGKEKMSYYLHQVSAYLDQGTEMAAKDAARSLVDNWDRA